MNIHYHSKVPFERYVFEKIVPQGSIYLKKNTAKTIIVTIFKNVLINKVEEQHLF